MGGTFGPYLEQRERSSQWRRRCERRSWHESKRPNYFGWLPIALQVNEVSRSGQVSAQRCNPSGLAGCRHELQNVLEIIGLDWLVLWFSCIFVPKIYSAVDTDLQLKHIKSWPLVVTTSCGKDMVNKKQDSASIGMLNITNRDKSTKHST